MRITEYFCIHHSGNILLFLSAENNNFIKLIASPLIEYNLYLLRAQITFPAPFHCTEISAGEQVGDKIVIVHHTASKLFVSSSSCFRFLLFPVLLVSDVH